MNNSRPIIKVVIAFFCFLFLAPSAEAATLVLPTRYQCDGLTFSSPLTVKESGRLSGTVVKVTFGTPKPQMKLLVASNKQILAESITPTPSPTKTIPTPTKEITPTEALKEATPTPQQPTPTSTTAASYASWGLNADTLFAMANSYRASKGLPPFQKDDRACQLASSRAPEVGAEIAEGHMHSGLRARNLPYWNSENIISYHSEEGAFNWWINDTIHREQIEGNYTYSCVACAGNSCAQEFTNFQAK